MGKPSIPIVITAYIYHRIWLYYSKGNYCVNNCYREPYRYDQFAAMGPRSTTDSAAHQLLAQPPRPACFMRVPIHVLVGHSKLTSWQWQPDPIFMTYSTVFYPSSNMAEKSI